MDPVKPASKKAKNRTVSLVLFPRELRDVARARRKGESFSDFVRAAIRHYASDRMEREG